MNRATRQRIMNEKISYMHVPLGRGKATIAAICHDGTVYYGIAFCDPNDPFSRKEGCTRAMRRLSVALRGLKQSSGGSFKAQFGAQDHVPMCHAALNNYTQSVDIQFIPHWSHVDDFEAALSTIS